MQQAIKRNLKVKNFVGTSENVLRIQIWTAQLAILILKWLHHLSQACWSLSNLAVLLRLNLFTFRDLKQLLENPLDTLPFVPIPEQLAPPLAGLGPGRCVNDNLALGSPLSSRFESLSIGSHHPIPGVLGQQCFKVVQQHSTANSPTKTPFPAGFPQDSSPFTTLRVWLFSAPTHLSLEANP
ncbi:MAG: hypothetical protein ABI039_10470 [Vicinamibacterales bacterium]